MTPGVNIDERIGRTVGRRRAPAALSISTEAGAEDARAWRRIFGLPFVPKGVYRFSSHQEADAWMTRILTRRAPSPANPPSPTSAPSAAN